MISTRYLLDYITYVLAVFSIVAAIVCSHVGYTIASINWCLWIVIAHMRLRDLEKINAKL